MAKSIHDLIEKIEQSCGNQSQGIMIALLMSAVNIKQKQFYHIKVIRNIQIPHDENLWPIRKLHSMRQKIIDPENCNVPQHRVFEYLSTVAKLEMEEKSMQQQIFRW